MYNVGTIKTCVLDGQAFESDPLKAYANELKHGISFEEACEALLDPMAVVVDASDSSDAEVRQACIGYSHRLLFCGSR